MVDVADEFPQFQRQRIIASVSFTPHAAHGSASQNWVYPTTCDVRGRSVAGPQLHYQHVVRNAGVFYAGWVRPESLEVLELCSTAFLFVSYYRPSGPTGSFDSSARFFKMSQKD